MGENANVRQNRNVIIQTFKGANKGKIRYSIKNTGFFGGAGGI